MMHNDAERTFFRSNLWLGNCLEQYSKILFSTIYHVQCHIDVTIRHTLQLQENHVKQNQREKKRFQVFHAINEVTFSSNFSHFKRTFMTGTKKSLTSYSYFLRYTLWRKCHFNLISDQNNVKL